MNIKRISALLLLVFCFSFAKAQSPIGTWKTVDDETGKAKSYVEIYKKGDKLYGKVVKLLDQRQDFKCSECKGAKKDKLVLGMNIIWDMEKDGDEWEEGSILDPKNGTTYSCKIWVDEDNPKELKVRGYVAFFFRTQTWYKVK